MANLSQHLFQVVNDEPVFCPVQLNIPCFKKLYVNDKTSDKSQYAKQLVFIWYYLDGSSPYFNSENKRSDCLNAAFGTDAYTISPDLQECMDEYLKRQSTAELRSLTEIVNILDETVSSLRKLMQHNTSEMDRYLDDINKRVAVEKDLDTRRTFFLMRSEIVKNSADESSSIISQIPKITSVIKEMVELRKTISKSLVELDSTSNKDNIANQIIYDIIDKFKNYKNV